MSFIRAAAEDNDIHIDKAVAVSEAETGNRYTALAHYLRSFGNLHNAPERTPGTYFHQCAIEMTCTQLARAGRFLAHLPGVPKMLSHAKVRRINALMMTCGHYDGSGNFAYRAGMPAKSGVGDASQTWLNDVAALMNNRPRKTPSWKNPAEAMVDEIAAFKSNVALEVGI